MLSIILLSYYSGDRISTSFRKLSEILSYEHIPFEFIIIDDGSMDNSFEVACELEKGNKNVFAYQLSKNYSSNYSIFAGLSRCNGECAVVIPDDEQQPYHTLVEMYKIWQGGEKIIVPFRQSRDDGFFNNLMARLYYKTINKLSDLKFPEGGADTFLIDREVIDILIHKIHPINTSIVAEVLRLGFSPSYYPYVRVKGLNTRSRWTMRKKIRLFKDTFFSTSTWPIKFITNLGLLFSLISFCIMIFYVYIALFGNPEFWGERVPGWTSTVVIISFFSGLILFAIGMLAEYIWRIYEEVKDRPGYIIRKKQKK
jgi:glycosyltransferase involved in cell wall biosynthesis